MQRSVSHEVVNGDAQPSISDRGSDESIGVLIIERNRMSSQLLVESLLRDSRFQTSLATPADAVAITRQVNPQVAVVSADFDAGAGSGHELTRSLTQQFPELGVLVLLDRVQRDGIVEAFRCGARGVFCRTESLNDLVKGIECVGRGQIWASRAESGCLLDALRSVPSPVFGKQAGVQSLTRRELQAVQYAAQGFTNRAIAEELRLSEHTVKNYLFRAFEKLGVSSRIELLFYLMVKGRKLEPSSSDDFMKEGEAVSIRKAALDGFPAAQFFLALSYRDGQNEESNPMEAFVWFCLAEYNAGQLGTLARASANQLRDQLSTEEIAEAEQKIAHLMSTIQSVVRRRAHGLVENDHNWMTTKISA